MASEKIVIKGQFRGFYTTTQSNNVGGADYFNLRWRNLILETGEKINEYISSDLKTGLYSYLYQQQILKLLVKLISTMKSPLKMLFLKIIKL